MLAPPRPHSTTIIRLAAPQDSLSATVRHYSKAVHCTHTTLVIVGWNHRPTPTPPPPPQHGAFGFAMPLVRLRRPRVWNGVCISRTR